MRLLSLYTVGIGAQIQRSMMLTGWIWIPLLFVAYYVGRRQIGLRTLLIFTAVEAIALFLFVGNFAYR